ncbi:MAG: hypothetical protein IM584_04640 [Chitinophagaceae bacterium]|jgi:hypothetical protein|nr:hypothetical protein [Chitinophagaceae bacterium]MCA6453628.1 hypothetical protein [Chitinophagaceae bacterium]MCA6455403.1 hypothetical protein [Chitinophagaceae bacterium]MCA6459045.1 hypothetical protein [Chitinophagaceae bacterium]MCA6465575.1 hypothetical protein [Chitinophagaceae bacterium]
MQKQYIRDILLSGRWRAYSIVVDTYINEIQELKPALFKTWLSKELGIDEDKINLNSLYSAFKRHRDNHSKTVQKGNAIRIDNYNIVSKDSTFKFSSPDQIQNKPRITEQ